VDGNVYRVLARYFGLTTPLGSNAAKKEFTTLAQSLLDENRPGDFNEAMMDFGAIQCTPQSPRCSDCPFALNCHAKQEGLQEQLPVKGKKTVIRERHLCYIYYRYEGQTAIHKRPAGDIWQGLWEPFLIEQTDRRTEHTDRAGIAKNNTEHTDRATRTSGVLLGKDIRHQLTHQSLYADFYLYECAEKPQLPPDYIWVKEEDLKQYGKPRLVERLLELLPQGE
jgi:A/G-specific adenine glycosylase